MNKKEQFLQEDEIDLRELFLTLWEKKWFIVIFTMLVTIASVVYVLSKNPTPVYTGSLMVETGQGNSFQSVNYDEKEILQRKFSVNVDIPRGTRSVIIVKAKGTDKEEIKKELQKAYDFLLQRDKEQSKLHEHYISTKKIENIKISNKPINTPKKKLIVVVAFVTGFILSIFLVFFMEFIKGLKKEEEK